MPDAAQGAVFTPSELAEGVLDLCNLRGACAGVRVLEPSAGEGAFVLPVIRRLLAAGAALSENSILAYEIHAETAQRLCSNVRSLLVEYDIPGPTIERLVAAWIRHEDFLLADVPGDFDLIVGNPPYVRQDKINKSALAEYRRRYGTMYDRADLYVPFYERCLDLLSTGGVLGFVCANRWTKNKFGGPLRAKIATGFSLVAYVDLSLSTVFPGVEAYAAVTVLRRGSDSGTLVAESAKGKRPIQSIVADVLCEPPKACAFVTGLVKNSDPWLLDAPTIVPLIRKIESRFPTLEAAGASVGIGVASGCDSVFIGQYVDLPVEPSRKLPLAAACDIVDGTFSYSGLGIVNPWLEDGSLAALTDFPMFGKYMTRCEALLKQRHVAKKQPDKWYKTIDRIRPSLVSGPKLLIPDIAAAADIAYDQGTAYPHHNLYTVTSSTWDLQVLRSILRSSIGLLFVSAYSVTMSGGYLRFQAQYLRRICVPHWASIPLRTRALLKTCPPNRAALDALVLPLFGLSPEEIQQLQQYVSTLTPGEQE